MIVSEVSIALAMDHAHGKLPNVWVGMDASVLNPRIGQSRPRWRDWIFFCFPDTSF